MYPLSNTQIIINPLRWMIYGALFALIASCAEEGITETNQRTLQIPISQELTEATITGIVTDEDGSAVSNATVSLLSGLQSITVQTAADGSFILDSIQNKGGAAYIKVESPGQFDAYRKMSVVPRRYNYTEIRMSERTVVGTIESTQGGTLSRADGATVTLEKDGFVTADGAKYQGPVTVAMNWINPAADDFTERMIGDLSGISESGDFQTLQSYGMITVELTDPAGNEVNITAESPAQLKFPIPTAMQDAATSTIPLWSYNEDLGTWIQEGQAYREENAYIGIVTHFSSFNVDHLTDPIEIQGRIVIDGSEGDTVGLSYLKVYVNIDGFSRKGGYLSNDGYFRFYNFPKDVAFTLDVYSKCSSPIATFDLGPYDDNKDLGELRVTDPPSNLVTVSGTALDCDNNPLADGKLTLFVGRSTDILPIEEDGSFKYVFDACSDSEVKLSLIDLAQFEGTEQTYPINGSELDAGNLVTCDQLSNYMILDLPGFNNPETVTTEHEYSFRNGYNFHKFTSKTSLDIDSMGDFNLKLYIEVDPNDASLINDAFIDINGAYTCYTDSTSNPTVVFEKYDLSSGGKIRGTYKETDVLCVDWVNDGEGIGNIDITFNVEIP